MRYLLVLFFGFSLIINAQAQKREIDTLSAYEFMWNFSVSLTASYERYAIDFEKNNIDSIKIEWERVDFVKETKEGTFVLRKPTPTLQGYVSWLNNWLNENRNQLLRGNK